MKKIMIPIMILLLCIPAFSQIETVFSGEIESGGYGGPEVKFGNINGDWEVLVGGRGGWIVNHQFILGGAGYGMPTKGDIPPALNPPLDYEKFEIGYGGVLIGYVYDSNSLIHLTTDVLIGGGGVSNGISESYHDYDDDAFFIVEPNVDFELNFTPGVRFGFGAGYRMTSGVEYLGLSDSDISGLSLNMNFKIGKF